MLHFFYFVYIFILILLTKGSICYYWNENGLDGRITRPNFYNRHGMTKWRRVGQSCGFMHQSIPAATIPPPRDSVGHLYAYLSQPLMVPTCPHGRAFAAACSPGGRAFVNIGLLPPGICRSQRKDRGHEFPLLSAKMDDY